MDVCALCKETRKLKESHIIPKFVGKWLKKTSATGYFRNVLEPNKRPQDLIKEYLLCGKCEQKFSDYEKPFAEKIFKPHHQGCNSFKYDEWLLKFIVSIQWRIILSRKNTITDTSDELIANLEIAQEVFRQYLNDESDNCGEYSHHLLFLDTIESITGDIFSDSPNMYFLRAIDATIASNGNSILFIYTKLPGLIINSHITPNNMEGWGNTLIGKNGTITLPQFCEVPGYGEFLDSRIELSKSYKKNINSGQVEKINESIEKNIEKLENSKSYKAAVADLNLKRREK